MIKNTFSSLIFVCFFLILESTVADFQTLVVHLHKSFMLPFVTREDSKDPPTPTTRPVTLCKLSLGHCVNYHWDIV